LEKQLTVTIPSKNSILTQNHLDFECERCKVTFGKPILAMVSSNGTVQRYYACPRCLSKIPEKKGKEVKRNVVLARKVEKMKEKHENVAGCKHFFGFLKKRSKGSPIPDECLTCSKMIECLTR